jgi:integrase
VSNVASRPLRRSEPLAAPVVAGDPSRHAEADRVSGRDRTRKATARIRDLASVDFRPHDLRRTAASLMTGSGISRVVVQKILNHVETGVTAIYDRYSYDNEKRIALDAWGRQVAAMVSDDYDGSNVLVFNRN